MLFGSTHRAWLVLPKLLMQQQQTSGGWQSPWHIRHGQPGWDQLFAIVPWAWIWPNVMLSPASSVDTAVIANPGMSRPA